MKKEDFIKKWTGKGLTKEDALEKWNKVKEIEFSKKKHQTSQITRKDEN